MHRYTKMFHLKTLGCALRRPVQALRITPVNNRGNTYATISEKGGEDEEKNARTQNYQVCNRPDCPLYKQKGSEEETEDETSTYKESLGAGFRELPLSDSSGDFRVHSAPSATEPALKIVKNVDRNQDGGESDEKPCIINIFLDPKTTMNPKNDVFVHFLQDALRKGDINEPFSRKIEAFLEKYGVNLEEGENGYRKKEIIEYNRGESNEEEVKEKSAFDRQSTLSKLWAYLFTSAESPEQKRSRSFEELTAEEMEALREFRERKQMEEDAGSCSTSDGVTRRSGGYRQSRREYSTCNNRGSSGKESSSNLLGPTRNEFKVRLVRYRHHQRRGLGEDGIATTQTKKFSSKKIVTTMLNDKKEIKINPAPSKELETLMPNLIKIKLENDDMLEPKMSFSLCNKEPVETKAQKLSCLKIATPQFGTCEKSAEKIIKIKCASYSKEINSCKEPPPPPPKPKSKSKCDIPGNSPQVAAAIWQCAPIPELNVVYDDVCKSLISTELPCGAPPNPCPKKTKIVTNRKFVCKKRPGPCDEKKSEKKKLVSKETEDACWEHCKEVLKETNDIRRNEFKKEHKSDYGKDCFKTNPVKMMTSCEKKTNSCEKKASSCGEMATSCGEMATSCEKKTSCENITSCGNITSCEKKTTSCGEMATSCGKKTTSCGKITSCEKKTSCARKNPPEEGSLTSPSSPRNRTGTLKNRFTTNVKPNVVMLKRQKHNDAKNNNNNNTVSCAEKKKKRKRKSSFILGGKNTSTTMMTRRRREIKSFSSSVPKRKEGCGCSDCPGKKDGSCECDNKKKSPCGGEKKENVCGAIKSEEKKKVDVCAKKETKEEEKLKKKFSCGAQKTSSCVGVKVKVRSACFADKEGKKNDCSAKKNVCGTKSEPCMAKKEVCGAKKEPCGAKKETCEAKKDPCGAKKEPCGAKKEPEKKPSICEASKSTCFKPKKSTCGERMKTGAKKAPPCAKKPTPCPATKAPSCADKKAPPCSATKAPSCATTKAPPCPSPKKDPCPKPEKKEPICATPDKGPCLGAKKSSRGAPKKKDDCQVKKESPCKAKSEPCMAKKETCMAKKEPCGAKKEPCGAKKESPCKATSKPCMTKKESPCKPKSEPCGAKKESPCMAKKEPPCKARSEPCMAKKEPCGAKKEPCGAKKEPCGGKKEPCGGKREPCGAKKEPCGAKKSPCDTKKESPCKPKSQPCMAKKPDDEKKSPCGEKKSPCGAKKSPCDDKKVPEKAPPCKAKSLPCLSKKSPPPPKPTPCPKKEPPCAPKKRRSPCKATSEPCKTKSESEPCGQKKEKDPCAKTCRKPKVIDVAAKIAEFQKRDTCKKEPPCPTKSTKKEPCGGSPKPKQTCSSPPKSDKKEATKSSKTPCPPAVKPQPPSKVLSKEEEAKLNAKKAKDRKFCPPTSGKMDADLTQKKKPKRCSDLLKEHDKEKKKSSAEKGSIKDMCNKGLESAIKSVQSFTKKEGKNDPKKAGLKSASPVISKDALSSAKAKVAAGGKNILAAGQTALNTFIYVLKEIKSVFTCDEQKLSEIKKETAIKTKQDGGGKDGGGKTGGDAPKTPPTTESKPSSDSKSGSSKVTKSKLDGSKDELKLDSKKDVVKLDSSKSGPKAVIVETIEEFFKAIKSDSKSSKNEGDVKSKKEDAPSQHLAKKVLDRKDQKNQKSAENLLDPQKISGKNKKVSSPSQDSTKSKKVLSLTEDKDINLVKKGSSLTQDSTKSEKVLRSPKEKSSSPSQDSTKNKKVLNLLEDKEKDINVVKKGSSLTQDSTKSEKDLRSPKGKGSSPTQDSTKTKKVLTFPEDKNKDTNLVKKLSTPTQDPTKIEKLTPSEDLKKLEEALIPPKNKDTNLVKKSSTPAQDSTKNEKALTSPKDKAEKVSSPTQDSTKTKKKVLSLPEDKDINLVKKGSSSAQDLTKSDKNVFDLDRNPAKIKDVLKKMLSPSQDLLKQDTDDKNKIVRASQKVSTPSKDKNVPKSDIDPQFTDIQKKMNLTKSNLIENKVDDKTKTKSKIDSKTQINKDLKETIKQIGVDAKKKMDETRRRVEDVENKSSSINIKKDDFQIKDLQKDLNKDVFDKLIIRRAKPDDDKEMLKDQYKIQDDALKKIEEGIKEQPKPSQPSQPSHPGQPNTKKSEVPDPVSIEERIQSEDHKEIIRKSEELPIGPISDEVVDDFEKRKVKERIRKKQQKIGNEDDFDHSFEASATNDPKVKAPLPKVTEIIDKLNKTPQDKIVKPTKKVCSELKLELEKIQEKLEQESSPALESIFEDLNKLMEETEWEKVENVRNKFDNIKKGIKMKAREEKEEKIEMFLKELVDVVMKIEEDALKRIEKAKETFQIAEQIISKDALKQEKKLDVQTKLDELKKLIQNDYFGAENSKGPVNELKKLIEKDFPEKLEDAKTYLSTINDLLDKIDPNSSSSSQIKEAKERVENLQKLFVGDKELKNHLGIDHKSLVKDAEEHQVKGKLEHGTIPETKCKVVGETKRMIYQSTGSLMSSYEGVHHRNEARRRRFEEGKDRFQMAKKELEQKMRKINDNNNNDNDNSGCNQQKKKFSTWTGKLP